MRSPLLLAAVFSVATLVVAAHVIQPTTTTKPSTVRYGINVDVDKNAPEGRPADFKGLHELGLKIVRFPIRISKWDGIKPWDAAQKKQVDHYISVLKELAVNGIQALLVVGGSTVSEPGPPSILGNAANPQNISKLSPEAKKEWLLKYEHDWSAYRSRYSAGVAKLVTAFIPHKVAWEVWNEPDELNNRQGYAPGMMPEQFGKLVEATFKAIKHADPHACVITGGSDGGQPSYFIAAGNATSTKSLSAFATRLGTHPYGTQPDPGWPAEYGKIAGPLEAGVKRYHDQIKMTMWMTEFGTESQNIQAEYVTRFLKRTQQLNGMVDGVILFCWSDQMVKGFGITEVVKGKLQQKPSYKSLKDFMASLPHH